MDPRPDVRVRFAPSPTGHPHVGNVRTALFNWLFARHEGGCLVLRIEDTDVARCVEGAVDSILDSLRWLGLDWDEGPYFQSERLHLYREIADQLVESGHAYYCYCSPERLEQVRQQQMSQRQPPRYDRRCRFIDADERARLAAEGIPPVVRFKTPLEGETTFEDRIRGRVTFDNSRLNDFILLKSDGYPTYHLANIVDDHFMHISHVLRADEWISSTPLHVLLYAALDWQPPEFAHLPIILGPDKAKLSKRHGATTAVEYREQGYLPQTMVNFLALLGWSLDDKTELLTREQLVEHFSLDRVGKTGAVFNRDKLDWMNGVYLRQLPVDEFFRIARTWLEHGLPPSVPRPIDDEYVRQMAPLLQERVKTLADLPELAEFFFVQDLSYEPSFLLGKRLDPDTATRAASAVVERLESLEAWDAESLEMTLRPLADELGLRTRDFFGLLRVATTGRTAAPPLFETMSVLGRATCLERLRGAIRRLEDLRE